MKHLQAGAAVGVLVLFVLTLVTALWALLELFVGPVVASGIIVIVIVAFIGAAILDWATERKEKA